MSATWLRRRVDPLLEEAIHLTVGLRLRDPLRWALAPARREALRRTVRAFGSAAAALAEGVVARDPSSIERHDALVRRALGAMRAEGTEGPFPDARAAVLGALDRLLQRDGEELMDDPSFPEAARVEALDVLHRVSFHAGSYDGFLAALRPLLGARGGAPLLRPRGKTTAPVPVRVHDLAAGHGGFAVLLKQRLGDRVTVEASDLRPEYLELGRARAAALEAEVSFSVQDALALDGLGARGVDVLVCTQALHHFTPGMVARMFGEAARAAEVGVAFVDGERSWLSLGLIGATAALYGRSYAFAHDALVSVRRMFYEEELGLLAALAPGLPRGRVETGTVWPAHAFVRFHRESADARREDACNEAKGAEAKDACNEATAG